MIRGHPVIRGHFLRTMSYLFHVKEPVTKGHLSYRDTFSGILRCPLKTGFTVTVSVAVVAAGVVVAAVSVAVAAVAVTVVHRPLFICSLGLVGYHGLFIVIMYRCLGIILGSHVMSLHNGRLHIYG